MTEYKKIYFDTAFSIKGMDALQIATYIHSDCQIFITNDKQLAKLPNINTLVLS